MYDDPLTYVNDALKARGWDRLDRLPKGERHSTEDCPLANAMCDSNMGEEVNGNYLFMFEREDAERIAQTWYGWDNAERFIELGEEGGRPGFWAVKLPDVLEQFASNFDDGEYPEFDIDEEDWSE